MIRGEPAARPRIPDGPESQARTVAAQVAGGTETGTPARLPETSNARGGLALPHGLRETFERATGADLSTVRIHADTAAAAMTAQAQARAVTIGEDIAMARGRYRPDDAAGRLLLAHETVHVLQQRHTGPRPQLDDEPATPERPVWISVSVNGLAVTSPGRVMPEGAPSNETYMRVVLKRIAPAATLEVVDQVISAMAAHPELIATGTLAPGRVIGPSENFDIVRLSPAAFAYMEKILGLHHVDTVLDEQQRNLLQLGLVAEDWRAEAMRELSQTYPWYVPKMWAAQLSMHGQVLQEAATARQKPQNASGSRTGLDLLLATFRRPLEVLEATRTDQSLGDVQSNTEQTTGGQRARVARAWTLLWGQGDQANTAIQEEYRVRAIQFYWTASRLYDPAVLDASARSQFLFRWINWFDRSVHHLLDPNGDATQELLRDPGPFTDQPFRATLEPAPPRTGGPLMVPAHVESRYRFSLEFPTVFDAFARYAYRWDVLEWPVSGGDRNDTAQRIASGSTDAARRRGQRATTAADLLLSRLRRDAAYARADVKTMAQEFGPAGISMSASLASTFLLRGFATAASTLVDIVTLEQGAGVRERLIQLPGPGLWVLRAVGVSMFQDSAEVRRAPSIAYIPVFAVPQRELAIQGLSEQVSAAENSGRERDEARAALAAMSAAGVDATRRDRVRSLTDNPAFSSGRWSGRVLDHIRMEQLLAEIRATLGDSAGEPLSRGEETLLRTQERALEWQLERNELMLATRSNRVSKRPELADARPLYATFVSDGGDTIPLVLDWVVVKGGRPLTVLLSDHTNPSSGIEEASGPTRDAAVLSALVSLLRGRSGYGRGLVSVQLPGGARQTERIEASSGALLNETLDSLTTIATVTSLALAPFTGGASLAILVPVGIVSGVRATERMYTRYDASTLRWDLSTLTDLVDVVSSIVAAGGMVRSAKGAFQISRIGRIAAVSFEVAENTTAYIILGAELERQLREIDATAGLSDRERRRRRMLALGNALVNVGIQAGSQLIAHSYSPRESEAAPPSKTSAPALPPAPGAPPVAAPPAMVPPVTDALPPAPAPESAPKVLPATPLTDLSHPVPAAEPPLLGKSAEAPHQTPDLPEAEGSGAVTNAPAPAAVSARATAAREAIAAADRDLKETPQALKNAEKAHRQEPGKWSSEPGVLKSARTKDGQHTVKVTESGRLVVCSVCDDAARRYAGELELDAKAGGTAKAELQKIHDELEPAIARRNEVVVEKALQDLVALEERLRNRRRTALSQDPGGSNRPSANEGEAGLHLEDLLRDEVQVLDKATKDRLRKEGDFWHPRSGLSYDAVRPLASWLNTPERWARLENSILDHLYRKTAVDRTFIDLTGVNAPQAQQIRVMVKRMAKQHGTPRAPVVWFPK
jgi:hypothetical protein